MNSKSTIREAMSRLHERCEIPFAIEVHQKEDMIFGGIASAFGTRIESMFGPTVIEKGAFANTLKHDKANIKVLWQHDTHTPIGVPVSMRETNEGLEVQAKISDTQAGRDAMTLIRDGVVDKMSIGFNPRKFGFEEREGEQFRIVQEVELFEFSPVTFPANPDADIRDFNSLDGMLSKIVGEAGGELYIDSHGLVRIKYVTDEAPEQTLEAKGEEPAAAPDLSELRDAELYCLARA